MRGAGFLAIWSDVEPDHLVDYRHWLTREHTTERVTTKGFLGVRVFRAARSGINRFFILYELESPEVLDGPAYLARLNAPTPWSQRIMPQLGNFVRGGGVMSARAGRRVRLCRGVGRNPTGLIVLVSGRQTSCTGIR